MQDLHGKAIYDYYTRKRTEKLILHNSYGEPEEMPVEVFFRDQLDFTTIEHLALIECEGTILDIGAGAGAQSLVLQEWGKEVTALDNSPKCAEVMQLSGIGQVICEDYRKHTSQYDTLLILMNGLGIAGRLKQIPEFLQQCRQLLNKNGQILVDSSDISYLYDEHYPRPEGYYGEVKYQYEYNGKKGNWFDWVYADETTLTDIVIKEGLQIEILHRDETDQYLARIYGF
ncbi:MAG: class I SAM-dependent methyltransferase [Cyclobacteriaceae bacterium]